MTNYYLPTLGANGYVKGLCEGAGVGSTLLAGFPTMYTVDFVSSVGVHGVNVFSLASQ